jgi:hypothetical protein
MLGVTMPLYVEIEFLILHVYISVAVLFTALLLARLKQWSFLHQLIDAEKNGL